MNFSDFADNIFVKNTENGVEEHEKVKNINFSEYIVISCYVRVFIYAFGFHKD